ncbi:MAG TPA: hypothetical protein IAB21_03475 [Candidatus Avelusimicrobium excrementipullorum]|nr:hypothetical protein [Candidatus Avelusimicrobium excrementipullorum]
MNINKQQLISIGLGLVSLLNKNIGDEFLENSPEKLEINYELPSGFSVSFTVKEVTK